MTHPLAAALAWVMKADVWVRPSARILLGPRPAGFGPAISPRLTSVPRGPGFVVPSPSGGAVYPGDGAFPYAGRAHFLVFACGGTEGD